MTQTNNDDKVIDIEIMFNCNIALSKIIVYTEIIQLSWSIMFMSGLSVNDVITYEFGQSHILDLTEFDSPVTDVIFRSSTNDRFTVKGLRLGSFPN